MAFARAAYTTEVCAIAPKCAKLSWGWAKNECRMLKELLAKPRCPHAG